MACATPSPPSIISFTDHEFHKTCFASFDFMRRKGKLCDVTLLSSGSRRFSAHRIVLAATIPFFNGMFLSNMVEVNKSEVPMLGLDTSALEAFINFAYTGVIQITPHNVQSLLIGASFLQLSSIRNICCRFIEERLSPYSVLSVRSFAQSFMCSNLVLACENYISDNFEAVSQTDDFLTMDGSELLTLLESDELCVTNEEGLFQSVLRWVEYEDKGKTFGDSPYEPALLSPATDAEDSSVLVGLENYALMKPDNDGECAPNPPQPLSDASEPALCSDVFGDNAVVLPIPSPCEMHMVSKKKTDTRIALLPELLKRIRLPLIPASYISNVISKHKLIRENILCRDLLDEVKDMLLLRDRPVTCSFSCRPRRGQDVFGIIYAVGGLTATGECHGIVETYHPSLGRWELSEPMPSQRSRIGVVTLNGLLYAIGGFDGSSRLNTTEVYDPKTKVWKTVAPMNFKRSALGATSLDGRLYVCGGYDGVSSLRSCEMYDPKQDRWLIIPSMNEPRSAGGLVALSNGCLYAVGGHNGLAIYSSTECYNPRASGPLARASAAEFQSNIRTLPPRITQVSPWQPMARMIHRRCRHGVTALRNQIIVAGGYNGVKFLRSVEVFDPVVGPDASGLMGQWTEVTSLSIPRSRVGLAVTGGRLYAIGGYDGITHLRTVECFQPPSSNTKNASGVNNLENAHDFTKQPDRSTLVLPNNQNASSSPLSQPDASITSSSDDEHDGDTDSVSTESSSFSASQESQTISQLESHTTRDSNSINHPSSSHVYQGTFFDWCWVPSASLIAHEGWVGVGVLPLDDAPEGQSAGTQNRNNSHSPGSTRPTVSSIGTDIFRVEMTRFRRGRTT